MNEPPDKKGTTAKRRIKGLSTAPILIFAYRRPRHLQRVLDELATERLAEKSPVIVYIDGPKHWWEKIQTERSFRIALQKRNFRKVTVIKRKKNLGLARSVITGIGQQIRKYGKVIVLEDDIVPRRGFLEYMNEGLERYRKNKKIMQIAGFRPPGSRDGVQVTFARLTTSWGWATWARAWRKFKMKIKISPSLQKQKASFDYGHSYPFFRLLEDAALRNSQSWAIRWYYACYRSKGFIAYPPVSYVNNIGFDGSGTHTKFARPGVFHKPIRPKNLIWPRQPRKSLSLQRAFQKYLPTISS